jgi:hypothetical protein
MLAFICCSVFAQQLTGVWSGKISRKTADYWGVENLEIQLYQMGKNLSGYSYAFKDTSRFVLYQIAGRRNKKNEIVQLSETGYGYYVLPPNYTPCEKQFSLKYSKIGKTQYLSGQWTGIGQDTSCFPGEELLVVLQKLKKPEYPLDRFVQKKISDYIKKKQVAADTITLPEPDEPKADVLNTDSTPAERKLDIQEIISMQDTTVQITLYDNATIDGDTVSVFVDKNAVIINQLISARPLTFTVTLKEPGKPVEIIMQAENLGSIPPNTAVMVIQAGKKRYEARLRSSFEKHAVVIITYNPVN